MRIELFCAVVCGEACSRMQYAFCVMNTVQCAPFELAAEIQVFR